MLIKAYKETMQKEFIYAIAGWMIVSVTFLFIGWGVLAVADSWFHIRLRQHIISTTILLFFYSVLIVAHFIPFHWRVAKRTATRWTTFIYLHVFFSLILTIILLLLLYKPFQSKQLYDTDVYILPDDFAGCGVIFYNVQHAPPLEIHDRKIVKSFLENGEVLLTSSPQHFGWASMAHSGWHKTEIHFRGEVLDGSEMRGATGSASNDEQTIHYSQIYVGADGLACIEPFEDIWGLYEKYVNKR